nr:hypothetical protein [Tanacetum cinerariifolium]
MRTRSSSNIPVESPPYPSTSNPKRRHRRSSKQPFILKESPVDTMADQRTMVELLRAPTEGYAKAILVPLILAEQFEHKHSLINMMTSYQYKDLLHACPHHGFTKLHQLDTFYNALNPADQDSLNSATGGNLLERRTQDVVTIIENKSKVRNSRNKSVVSQVKSSYANSNSSFEIAKLIHAVNQQTSAVTTAMTAILKQFQATPPLASIKAVEEICVTFGGAHPYYQCLAVGGNTFPKLKDNIEGYVAAAAVNYNQGELKSITTRSGIVLDGPSVPIPSPFINPEEDERVEETLTDQDLAEYTLKVPPPLVQKPKPPSQRNFVVHQRDPLHPNIYYPLRMLRKSSKKKMNSPFQQGELLKLANTPLNENCSAVILKKLPKKHGDPRKFLILCGFSELKYKALSDLGASINLMPLYVWKKLGLPELISTRMTLELANRAICTPVEITRDFFIPVGKFTFPANFVIVDYENDPRVPLILGRPFLRTGRALIDVHGEEIILRDGDERLALNMRHDTSSYSNQPQKESINLINVFNNSSEDFLENLFKTNHQSGNPTFSPHPKLTSPEVKDDVFNPEGGSVLPEKFLYLDSTKDLYPPHLVNPLSGSTSSSSPNHLLEEFADELALITFLPGNDDLPFDIDNLADLNENLVDTMPEMFIDKHALDYSSPPLYDEYDDDLFEVDSNTEYVYDDHFDSKGEKIKESKLLIDKLDLPSDFFPSSEYDSFLFEDFSEVDALPSTNNKDKVFNLGILIQENLSKVITCVAPDKNEKKLAISHASSILEDFDPLLNELPSFKEIPDAKTLL